MACLHILITRTKLGRSIRAVADNTAHATLLGIDAQAVSQQVFFLASGLGCVAGLLLAFHLGTASSTIGFEFGLKALAVMAIGGVGDLRGAVVGGLAIGVVESLAVNYGFGQLTDLLVWGCMIAVLIVRPQGIFGSGMREHRA
jgi:branched-chain amino acid transport system permease protein